MEELDQKFIIVHIPLSANAYVRTAFTNPVLLLVGVQDIYKSTSEHNGEEFPTRSDAM